MDQSTEPTILYVVEDGLTEGGGLAIGVFSSLERAVEFAEVQVNDYRDSHSGQEWSHVIDPDFMGLAQVWWCPREIRYFGIRELRLDETSERPQ